MFLTTLIVAAALGQMPAPSSTYPPREWLYGLVEGQTVRLWGWRNWPSGVSFYHAENPQLFGADRRLKRRPDPLSPGQVIDRDGVVNNGLILQQKPPTHRLETNDPDLGKKLLLQDEPAHCELHADGPCPGPGPCPKPRPRPPILPDPFRPDEPPPFPYREYLTPAALVIGALLVAAAVYASRRNP